MEQNTDKWTDSEILRRCWVYMWLGKYNATFNAANTNRQLAYITWAFLLEGWMQTERNPWRNRGAPRLAVPLRESPEVFGWKTPDVNRFLIHSKIKSVKQLSVTQAPLQVSHIQIKSRWDVRHFHLHLVTYTRFCWSDHEYDVWIRLCFLGYM